MWPIMQTTLAINQSKEEQQLDEVFAKASDLFAVLSSPARLKILHFLCTVERSVSDVVAFVGGTQPNVSQHLALMYRAGVLAKRKDGAVVFYRVASEQAVAVCRSVCTQIAMETGMEEPQ
jgi:DNA-binding transcriptional ArsR family regulator